MNNNAFLHNQPEKSAQGEFSARSRDELQAYPNCFGCGPNNPVGLQLTYRFQGDALVTDFMPGGTHEGWPGIVHGGILATLLYEVMENFAFRNGIITMMRDMEVQFRRPANIGRNITALARLELSADREMSVTGTLVQNTVIAEGSARLVSLTQEHIDRLGINANPHASGEG